MQLPQIGDIVHVTLEKDIVRPAIVTDVHEGTAISCSVFLAPGDASKGAIARYTDTAPPGCIFTGGHVSFDEGGSVPYNWHWPTRS